MPKSVKHTRYGWLSERKPSRGARDAALSYSASKAESRFRSMFLILANVIPLFYNTICIMIAARRCSIRFDEQGLTWHRRSDAGKRRATC